MIIESSYENLKALFEKIKNISFFERIFKWGAIIKLLILAISEFERLSNQLNEGANKISELQSDSRLMTNKFENLEEKYNSNHDELIELKAKQSSISEEITRFKSELAKSESTIGSLTRERITLTNENIAQKQRLDSLQQNFEEVKDERNRLKQSEESRVTLHDQAINSLKDLYEQVKKEREDEKELAHKNELKKLTELKETWNRHQENVKSRLQLLAEKLTIEYVKDVPFKGQPDNTLRICDEFVVFDAKSPGGDDLKNFETYLKKEAEAAKKYAKQENVKSDLFFIVPTNTLEHLRVFAYKCGDHNVYIVSIDSIEPVIIGLKKIEDYEFAEQLAPEDREDICRIIGRFAHLSKRRIQVDNFFAKHFIELAYKCENDLPADILNMVVEYEKSEKINPPMEKRVKNIPTAELEHNNKKLKTEAEGRGIIIENTKISNSLDELPLYKTDQE
jgi:hypothetical protein